MKNFFQLIFVLCLFSVHAQTEFDGSEIGVEIFAARAGSNGGTMGAGFKYAAILNENFAVGPSFRYHRTWNYLYNGLATDIPSSASITVEVFLRMHVTRMHYLEVSNLNYLKHLSTLAKLEVNLNHG